MELEALVYSVRSQLVATAALGDERTREIAEALALAAEPAVRLVVLNAASAIAEEMNAALIAAPGQPTLSVRLEDGDIRVDLTAGEAPTASVPSSPSDDGEATARVSLRLTDALKSEIDEAARREGVSVNTWLVRSAAAALASVRSVRPAGPGGAHRITGWING